MIQSLAAANRLYLACADLSVGYHSLDHPLLREFVHATRELERELDDNLSADDIWRAFLIPLRRYRFRASAAPIPFDHPNGISNQAVAELKDIARGLSISYPRWSNAIGAALASLEALRASRDNPLMDRVRELVNSTSFERRALLVADSRLVAATVDVLRHDGGLSTIDVLTEAALRRASAYDHLIEIGSARWYPEHVISAPRASLVDVVSYAWNASKWRLTPSLRFPTVVGRPVNIRSETSVGETLDVDQLDTGDAMKRLERSIASDGSDGEGFESAELLPARLYFLNGGWAVFLEATGRKTTLLIDLGAGVDRRVGQLSDDEIELDMFVVLRTDTAADYIPPIADRLLGDIAPKYRESISSWKARLRSRCSKLGIAESCRLLSRLGISDISYQTLRLWISNRNIGPRSENDFNVLLRFIVAEEDAARSQWNAVLALRRAHTRAGMLVYRRLLEKVRTTDLDDLVKAGEMRFGLDGVPGVTLTAFRIEGRSGEIVQLSANRIERVFPRED